MKKIALLTTVLAFISTLAFAQDQPVAQQPLPEQPVQEAPGIETLMLRGYIIDNLCAGTQTPEELAEFVKTHSKECALSSPCVASGYSIFADGQLLKFDSESNAKVEEFLKNPDSKLEAAVEAVKAGEELSLISIANQ